MLSTTILRSPFVLLSVCAAAAIVLALALEALGGTTVDLNAVLGAAFFVLLAVACGMTALIRQES